MIAAPVAIAIVMLAFVVTWRFLESDLVRTVVARRVESLVERATAMELRIGALEWAVFPPRIVLSSTTLSGQSLHLEFERASVDLGGLWIGNRTLTLDAVEVLGLRVEARAPASPARSGGDGLPLRIVVRQLDVNGVEFNGEALPGGVAASCRGMDLAWVVDESATTGFVAIDQLEVEAPGIERAQAAVTARFIWRGERLDVPTWRIENDDVRLRGSFEWSEQGIGGHVSGEVELTELDRVIRAHGVLEGAMTLDADFEVQGEPRLQATISARRLTVQDLPLTNFRARIDVDAAGLSGDVESGQFFGGELRGSYHLRSLRYPFPHEVEARCDGFDLAPFLQTLGVPSGGLSSHGNITTVLAWESDNFPQGSGNATVVFEPDTGLLPMAGTLELGLLPPGVLQFNGNGLTVGSSLLTLEGPLTLKTWRPEWSIRADPGVLEEIIPAVNRWVGSRALPEEITGRGRVAVSLSGPWKRLLVGMRLDILDLAYPPIVLDRALLEAQVSDGECRIEHARFSVGEGSGEVRGVLSWDHEADREGLDLRIGGRQLSLNGAGSWLGLGDLQVDGELSFSGGLGGTIAAPRGSWAAGVTGLSVAGQVVGDGSATIELGAGVFSARKIDFDRGLNGGLRWNPTARVLNGDLRWQGMEMADQPQWARRLLGSRFDCDLVFDWPYGVGSPEGAMIVDGEEGHLGVTFADKGLQIQARRDGVIEGEVEIVADPGEAGWHGSGQVRILSAAELVQSVAPGLDVPLVGRSAIDVTLVGEGTHVDELAGRFGATDLRLNDRPFQLINDRGWVWDRLGFRLAGIEVAVGTEAVFFRGAIGADGGLAGNLSGALDAVLLRFLVPEWEPTGRLTGVVELLGTISDPLLEGIARVEGGSFRLPRSRSVVSDLNGSLFLSSGEVVLEDMGFRFMRGSGRCRGTIVVRDGQPRLRLGGAVTGLEYPLFPGLSPRLGGSWRLDGAASDLRLSGELVVERGEVRGRDDLASLIVEWFGDERPPREQTLQLDLRVKADQTLVARSAFLRVVGSADLHVTGTDAQPGLVGRIEFQEGGEFTLQGVRYELDRGQITFSDPTRVDPMFNFQTRARILDYEVFLQLNGSQDRLVPSVSSDPPLSPPEIYSLMALGTVGEGRAGGALGISLASSMLTKSLNQTLSGRDSWLLPVDQIRVDPYIEAHTGDPSARVTVVKQLSPSVTVTLQSNLSGESDEVISIRWYTGSGYFWEASRDADGSIGADFKLRRRY